MMTAMAVTATTARHMIVSTMGDTPSRSVQYTRSLTSGLAIRPRRLIAMTNDPQSELPSPVEISGFDFLLSPVSRHHAVLEFRTASRPIRVLLTKSEILELVSKAGIAASKVTPI